MKMVIKKGWGFSIRPYKEGEEVGGDSFILSDLPERFWSDRRKEVTIPGVDKTVICDFSEDDSMKLVALWEMKLPWERVQSLSGREAIKMRDTFRQERLKKLTEDRYKDYPEGAKALTLLSKLNCYCEDKEFLLAKTTKEEYIRLCKEFEDDYTLSYVAQCLSEEMHEEHRAEWENWEDEG